MCDTDGLYTIHVLTYQIIKLLYDQKDDKVLMMYLIWSSTTLMFLLSTWHSDFSSLKKEGWYYWKTDTFQNSSSFSEMLCSLNT